MTESIDKSVNIARSILALLKGCEYADAFPALVAVMAETIISGAPSKADARKVARMVGSDPMHMVEEGPVTHAKR